MISGVSVFAVATLRKDICISDLLGGLRFLSPLKKMDSRGGEIGDTHVAMDLAEITCPTCFEVFEVAVPHPDEMPTEVDYDCEVCCRPMMIFFTEDEVYAKGLGD